MDQLIPRRRKGGQLLSIPKHPDLGATLLPHPLYRLPSLPQDASHLPTGGQHPTAHGARHLPLLLFPSHRLFALDSVAHHVLPRPDRRGGASGPEMTSTASSPTGGWSTWRSREGRSAAARLEGQSKRSVVVGRLVEGEGVEEEEEEEAPAPAPAGVETTSMGIGRLS